MLKHGWSLALSVLLGLTFCAPSVLAGPLEDGIKAYNAKQYKQALGYFGAAGRQAPGNPQVYYYLGLCYQGMHQYALARQHFEWVANNCGSTPVGIQARTALNQVNKLSPGSAQSGGSVSSAGGGGAQQSASGFPAPSQPVSGRLRVLEFSIEH